MFGVEIDMIVANSKNLWMLHEVVREVSFEERCKIMEAQMAERNGT